MAVKIFRKGNYIEIIDNGKRQTKSAAKVEIVENNESADVYDILFDGVFQKSYAFAEIQDEAGSPYADVATWETFYKSNTGFNPANASSVQALASQIDAKPDVNSFTDGNLFKSDSNGDLVDTGFRPEDLLSTNTTFYLTNDASDIGGYLQATLDVPAGAETSITTSDLGVGQHLVATFLTNTGIPGKNELFQGVITAAFKASRTQTVGVKTVKLYFEFFTRTTGGAETTHATSNLSDSILVANQKVYPNAIQTDASISETDRWGIRVYMDISGTGGDVGINLQLEGAFASRWESPTVTGVSSKVQYTVAQMEAASPVIGKTIYNTELKDDFVGDGTNWIGTRIVTLNNNSGGNIDVNLNVVPDPSNDNSVITSILAADENKSIGICAFLSPNGGKIYLRNCVVVDVVASQATTRGQYVYPSLVTAGRTYTSSSGLDGAIGIALTSAALAGEVYKMAAIKAEIF